MKDMDDASGAGSSKDVNPLKESSPTTGRKRDREKQSDCEAAMSYDSSDNDSNESMKKKRKNKFIPTKSQPELKRDETTSDRKDEQGSTKICPCSTSGEPEESKKVEDPDLDTILNMDSADHDNPSTSFSNSSQQTRRRYRIRTVESSDSENEDGEGNTSSEHRRGENAEEEDRSSPIFESAASPSAEENEVDFSDTERPARRLRNFLRGRSESSNSSSESSEEENSDSDNDYDESDIPNQIKEKVESINIKTKPNHTFNITKELLNRQYGGLGVAGKRIPGGGQSRFGLQFSDKFYNSLHVVERLELLHKLKDHTGCVNAVGFNESGNLLLSGSDDLKVCLWDWNKNKLVASFQTGHRTNVFQCKFLLGGDGNIVTSSRDGQVRHAILTPDGDMKSISVLSKHRLACHKLGLSEFNPHIVLSAGEEGEVKESDIRIKNSSKTIAVNMNSEGRKVPLYSLHNNPVNEYQYCISGQDRFVSVYDRRITSVITPPVLKYAADDLTNQNSSSSVTCAVYSNNGDAICASYNEDDIFLFDTKLSDGSAPIKRYSGHKNSATIKGVNMFGPDSRFIMSGSDCGNIFIWDRETEAIVNCMKGDSCGVVNVLEWHPHLPVLASSGLDSDVKVWLPLKSSPPDLSNITKIITSNLHKLRSRRTYLYSPFMANNMLEIFQRLRSIRGAEIGGDSDADNEEDDDDEDLNEVGMPCELQ